MKKKIIKKSIALSTFLIFFFLFSATSVFAVEPNQPASSDITIEQTPSEQAPSGIAINDDLLGFSRESANWFKDTIFQSVGTVTTVGLWIFVGILGIFIFSKIIRYFLD